MSKEQRRKWTIAGLVIAALAALGIGAASAADKKKTGGGRDPLAPGGGGPYTGPGPRLPGGNYGGGSGQKPPVNEPPEVAPNDLWISPECDVVVIGDTWFPEVAVPAIEVWAMDGVPARTPLGSLTTDPALSPERVVREILGPYAPLCIDTWPWRDVLMEQNPEPQREDFPDDDQGYDAYLADHVAWDTWINNQVRNASMDRPQFANLVGEVYAAVLGVAVTEA